MQQFHREWGLAENTTHYSLARNVKVSGIREMFILLDTHTHTTTLSNFIVNNKKKLQFFSHFQKSSNYHIKRILLQTNLSYKKFLRDSS